MIRDLYLPDCPPEFACSTTVPLDRSPAAHSLAGRQAALHALARAGCTVTELPPKSAPRPRWPDGFVGSIAHDDAMAIAVAARVDTTVAVGIDVERHDALSPADASVVLRDEELDDIGSDASLATMLWTAKEAAYKAWCTGLDADLDHTDPRDIHIGRLDARGVESTWLVARALGDLAPRVAAVGELQVRSLRAGDLVITLAWRPDRATAGQSAASAVMPSRMSDATAPSPST
jgi:4'-phosphopantetheinyl transferase EntD